MADYLVYDDVRDRPATGVRKPTAGVPNTIALPKTGVPDPTRTKKLYEGLVESVLPRLTRPTSARAIETLLKQAGVDDAAKSTGFTTWLRANGSRRLTRAMLLTRLMQEPEFQQLIAAESGRPAAHPSWQATQQLADTLTGGPSPMGAAIAKVSALPNADEAP